MPSALKVGAKKRVGKERRPHDLKENNLLLKRGAREAILKIILYVCRVRLI